MKLKSARQSYFFLFLFLLGCFEPKVLDAPQSINDLALLKKGDPHYKMEETLHRTDDLKKIHTLSQQSIHFKYIKDSNVAGQTQSYFNMTIIDDATHDTLSKSYFLAKFQEQTIEYRSLPKEAGPKFFLLKSAARSEDKSQDKYFQSIGSLLLSSPPWTEKRGDFQFTRSIEGQRNFKYHGHLEKCWVVDENLIYNGQTLMTAQYLYGQSGLLKCRQDWLNFEKRDALGASEGAFLLRKTYLLR